MKCNNDLIIKSQKYNNQCRRKATLLNWKCKVRKEETKKQPKDVLKFGSPHLTKK